MPPVKVLKVELVFILCLTAGITLSCPEPVSNHEARSIYKFKTANRETHKVSLLMRFVQFPFKTHLVLTLMFWKKQLTSC